MLQIDDQLTASDLLPQIAHTMELAGKKIRSIDASAAKIGGTPVFTVNGQYQAQGWTEWTQGFQYGSALLHFDATDDEQSLAIGRDNTMQQMAAHVTHVGVHDHGFNQVSTYGNLRRLMLENRLPQNAAELAFYELALQASGAVQAHRWTETSDGGGFIHSFNGPHSLFSDTIRSLRALALAHELGHVLWAENDRRISLLERLVQHARATAEYNVYYGADRDAYDVWGRVVHESIFNTNDGNYRCPSTQQGYSPFSTWTRGLAWVMLGYPEQLQWIATRDDAELQPLGGRREIESMMLQAARASCDFFIANTPTCGIPYWDTGAPGLVHLGDYLDRPAEPENPFEPVDSSAAAIGAQGLLRLGKHLMAQGDQADGKRYWQAGLTTARTLMQAPYLSEETSHQGLLLHVIYHRPRGWDHVPDGCQVPCRESCMWGDYHLLELALYLKREAEGGHEYRFDAKP